jgi:hypothetical protein
MSDREPTADIWHPNEREEIIQFADIAPAVCELESCRDPVTIVRRLCDFAWRYVNRSTDREPTAEELREALVAWENAIRPCAARLDMIRSGWIIIYWRYNAPTSDIKYYESAADLIRWLREQVKGKAQP